MTIAIVVIATFIATTLMLLAAVAFGTAARRGDDDDDRRLSEHAERIAARNGAPWQPHVEAAPSRPPFDQDAETGPDWHERKNYP